MKNFTESIKNKRVIYETFIKRWKKPNEEESSIFKDIITPPIEPHGGMCHFTNISVNLCYCKICESYKEFYKDLHSPDPNEFYKSMQDYEQNSMKCPQCEDVNVISMSPAEIEEYSTISTIDALVIIPANSVKCPSCNKIFCPSCEDVRCVKSFISPCPGPDCLCNCEREKYELS